MNLDYDQIQKTDAVTEQILGRFLQTTLPDLERSAGHGCHTCTILRYGIQVVCPKWFQADVGKPPIVIRQRRGLSLELRVGDVVDCDTIEFYTHLGSGVVDTFEHDRLTLTGLPTPWDAFGPARDVSTQLNIAECLEKVRKWIEVCDSNHPGCASSQPTKLPTRVLDVGDSGNQKLVKLCETRGDLGRYMTLSHCWGKKQIITTTQATLTQLKSEVRWSRLSRTFQDAISITRELGVRYIWIDSFCIIQDDRDDWKRESARMAEIYANSYLNLAATGSADGNGGCFFDRWTSSGKSRPPVRLHEIKHEVEGRTVRVFARRLLSDAHIHFTDLEPPNAEDILDAAPLLSRAWVMQERFLTARTVHFHSAELVWECKKSLLCECGGLDHHSNSVMQQATRLKSTCAEAFAGTKQPHELGALWFELVTLYSRLKLTNESDRLPALSGLAKRFGDLARGAYLGGLWESDLPKALLWQACPSMYGGGEARRTALLDGTPPTWSWASVQLHDTDFSGFVTYETATYMGFERDRRLRIFAVSCRPVSLNPFGHVSDGRMDIQGALISTIVCHEHSHEDIPPCLISDRNETFDTVLVSKEDLIVDVPLYKSGPGQIYDGETLYCLLIGHTTRDMAREGELPELFSLSLVLKQSAHVPGSYERVGMLQSRQDENWFDEATESFITII
jgi:Heterokaryon incompatibility protein (HET)